MEFIVMAMVLLVLDFIADTAAPRKMVHALTDDDLDRIGRMYGAVIAAKTALRNNDPAGYANASKEMRKYA